MPRISIPCAMSRYVPRQKPLVVIEPSVFFFEHQGNQKQSKKDCSQRQYNIFVLNPKSEND